MLNPSGGRGHSALPPGRRTLLGHLPEVIAVGLVLGFGYAVVSLLGGLRGRGTQTPVFPPSDAGEAAGAKPGLSPAAAGPRGRAVGAEAGARALAEAQGRAYDFAAFAAGSVQQTGLPAGRIGSPADIAHAVAFLVSPLADYVTGANLRVDGGMMPTVN